MCLMHRVCGAGPEASTDGGRRAPIALGDDVERATRVLRIEGLATAAASTFYLSADQPPPPPSSARTARPYLPTTHGVEHGEWRGEHRAVVGLAGTVGGEQRPSRLRCEDGGLCLSKLGAKTKLAH